MVRYNSSPAGDGAAVGIMFLEAEQDSIKKLSDKSQHTSGLFLIILSIKQVP